MESKFLCDLLDCESGVLWLLNGEQIYSGFGLRFIRGFIQETLTKGAKVRFSEDRAPVSSVHMLSLDNKMGRLELSLSIICGCPANGPLEGVVYFKYTDRKEVTLEGSFYSW